MLSANNAIEILKTQKGNFVFAVVWCEQTIKLMSHIDVTGAEGEEGEEVEAAEEGGEEGGDGE